MDELVEVFNRPLLNCCSLCKQMPERLCDNCSEERDYIGDLEWDDAQLMGLYLDLEYGLGQFIN